MDVFIWGWKLNTICVHSDWDDFSFVWTSIHYFVLDQGLCFSHIFCACSKSLLSDQTDFHAFDFDFD
jgi:hypothetical protein